MTFRLSPAFALIAALAVSLPASAQKESADGLPELRRKKSAGASPNGLSSSPHSLSTGEARQPYINYPETVTWYGALTFAQLSGDKDLRSRLIQRFDPLYHKDSKTYSEPSMWILTIFGAVPLELYIETRQQKYLDLGRELADKQWADPTSDGLTGQTRYWIDDMYMITLVQIQAYRATSDPKYLDPAALEMSAYLDKLQQPNGLFYHAPDAPFFWGRGNGWVAAGMTELLRSLPQRHPRRALILEAYRRMMAALLKYQAKDGMWRQCWIIRSLA